MNLFHLTIASPEGNTFDGEVAKLDVRGVEGELAVMAGHVPFVTSVVKAPCAVWMADGTKRDATCDGGVLSVGPDRVLFISGSFQFL